MESYVPHVANSPQEEEKSSKKAKKTKKKKQVRTRCALPRAALSADAHGRDLSGDRSNLHHVHRDPNAPKRGRTSYIVFSDMHRPALAKKYKNMKMTEISKKLGEMWKKVSDKDKAKCEKTVRNHVFLVSVSWLV